MSLMKEIKKQQDKREAEMDALTSGPEPELESPDLTLVRQPAAPMAVAPAPAPASAPFAKSVQRMQQLGYRVPVETFQAFESFRTEIAQLAIQHGLRRPTAGDLVNEALKLYMTHDPRSLLGLS